MDDFDKELNEFSQAYKTIVGFNCIVAGITLTLATGIVGAVIWAIIQLVNHYTK